MVGSGIDCAWDYMAANRDRLDEMGEEIDQELSALAARFGISRWGVSSIWGNLGFRETLNTRRRNQ